MSKKRFARDISLWVHVWVLWLLVTAFPNVFNNVEGLLNPSLSASPSKCLGMNASLVCDTSCDTF